MQPQHKLWQRQLLWLLAFVPLGVLYWFSGPTALPEADAGEFAAIAVAGGIAHPPGYPLLSILLQGFAHLRHWLGLIPALSLMSILCNCLAAGFMAATLFALSRNRIAAMTTTYLIFLSVNIWRAGTTIEPFALNILQASIILYVVYRLSTDPLWNRGKAILFLLLGVVYGTGVCNHHSLALTFPLAVVALVNNRTHLLRAVGLLVCGMIVGMAPLVYFFMPQQLGAPLWGDWSNPWQRLPAHLLRTEFGTTRLFFTAHGSWLAGPLVFLRTLPVRLSIVPFLLAVVGGTTCVIQFWPHRKNEVLSVKVFGVGVACTLLLSGIVFPALFRLDNSDASSIVVTRFFSLPTLFLAFPLLYGLIIVLKRIQSPIVRGVFVMTFIGLHVVYQWPDAERRHQTFFENHIRNIITVAEPNAIIIGSSDQDYMIGLYARYVFGAHDMSFVFVNLNNLAWYQTALVRELGINFSRHSASVENFCKLLLEKRPVYIHSLPPKELIPLLKHSYPRGPLARLQKDDDVRPDARSLFHLNEDLLKNRLTLPSPRQINVHYPWDEAVLDCYAQTWRIIEAALIVEGDSVLADRAQAYQNFFSPPASVIKKQRCTFWKKIQGY
jgi:hypothetical protein